MKNKKIRPKIILVSATIPDENSKRKKDMNILSAFKSTVGTDYDSVRLTSNKDLAGDYIKKYKIKCDNFDDKMRFIIDLYGIQAETKDLGQCIVFCTNKQSLAKLGDFVRNHDDMKDTEVLVLSGSLKGDKRDKVVREFREGVHKILISTDVLARGFNLPDVSVVINFEVPYEQETYIHRMGRCGRIDQDRVHQKGVCITLLGDGTSPSQEERGIRPDPNYEVNKFKKIEQGLAPGVISTSVDRTNIEEISKVFEHAERAKTKRG
eukprot:CAMPEP_0185255332 /NCGR_PEP_ID=MMETSP1359-20130426/4351_1 /TAXON_ID=552665 /ORGANISM="Bigelowiella longifila, Strain CCMP242" /LENGTH=264 /DNA_ID=CAMNT_0027839131 /DNA_START=108 /DNA_END=902 /DNA_ORIENTATION=+